MLKSQIQLSFKYDPIHPSILLSSTDNIPTFRKVSNWLSFFPHSNKNRLRKTPTHNRTLQPSGRITKFYLDSRLNTLQSKKVAVERSTLTSPNIIDQSLKCSENKNSTLGQMGKDSYDCVTKQEKWFEKTVASTFFNTTTKICLRDTFNGHFTTEFTSEYQRLQWNKKWSSTTARF